MTCQHATPIFERVNACGLGLHGGRPSSGVCAYCVSRGENTPEHATKLPPIAKQAASLGRSLLNWTTSKFAATPPDILAAREATCRACPEWDATALNNTGRCRKCGCSTWAKIRMATERCPLGKWESLTPRQH
jgi:hypothetical protein